MRLPGLGISLIFGAPARARARARARPLNNRFLPARGSVGRRIPTTLAGGRRAQIKASEPLKPLGFPDPYLLQTGYKDGRDLLELHKSQLPDARRPPAGKGDWPSIRTFPVASAYPSWRRMRHSLPRTADGDVDNRLYSFRPFATHKVHRWRHKTYAPVFTEKGEEDNEILTYPHNIVPVDEPSDGRNHEADTVAESGGDEAAEDTLDDLTLAEDTLELEPEEEDRHLGPAQAWLEQEGLANLAEPVNREPLPDHVAEAFRDLHERIHGAKLQGIKPTKLHGEKKDTKTKKQNSSRKPKEEKERTYKTALRDLASLKGNAEVRSRFQTGPATATASTSQTEGVNAASQTENANAASQTENLNAGAAEEHMLWMNRASTFPSALGRMHFIHVAGTKGKGSVCAYLTALLRHEAAQGRVGRLGTFTSPHLVSVRERICINGFPLSQEDFTRYFYELWDRFTMSATQRYAAEIGQSSEEEMAKFPASVWNELKGPGSKPFYFRFLTILALYAFLRRGVRTAIIECGIGGEYDCTNVLPAQAVTTTAVTHLEIDHVSMLGSTLAEIAWHKAGIMKKDVPCFTAPLQGADGLAAMDVMQKRAEEKGARLELVDSAKVKVWDDMPVKATTPTMTSTDTSWTTATQIPGGSFQKDNKALAVAVAQNHLRTMSARLNLEPRQLDDECIATALGRARLRGRCEVVERYRITWLLDGAHTTESLRETARWYAEHRRRLLKATPERGQPPRPLLVFNQQDPDRDGAALLNDFLVAVDREMGSPGPHFHRASFPTNKLIRSFGREHTTQEPSAALEAAMTPVKRQEIARAFQKACPHAEISMNQYVASEIAQIINHVPGQKLVVLVTGSLHLVGAVLRSLDQEPLLWATL